MGSQIANFMFYALGAVVVLFWGVIIVRRWAIAAMRRGGQWELEALMLICGPLTAAVIAFYPASGGGPGALGNVNRLLMDAAYGLAAIGILRGVLSRGRHAKGLVSALLVYYLSLIASGIGGVVPGIPEAYWLTPMVVLAFVLNAGCKVEWFVQMCRIALRSIVILSIAAAFVVPEIAFNTDEIRTLYGLDRLAGITSHPNTLGILAALGLILELKNKSRARMFFSLIMVAGVLLAQSSTAYVAVCVAALLVTSRFSRLLRRLAVAGVMATLVAALAIPEVSNGISSALSLKEAVTLLNGRTGIWDAALAGFHLNPLWGYGPSLLDERYRQIYLPHFGAGAQAHNQWFQTLGDSGIFGAFALVVLLIVMMTYALRVRISTSGLSLAVFAMFVVRSVTETPLRPGGTSLITFILLITVGILAFGQREQVAESPADESEDLQPRSALVRTVRAR